MRSLKDIYPRYSEDLDLYAVSIDLEATPEEILDFGDAQGLTFPIVFSGVSMVPNFNVKSQATMIALDAAGTVVYRSDAGGASADYESLMAELAASPRAAN